jgi:cytochrome c556
MMQFKQVSAATWRRTIVVGLLAVCGSTASAEQYTDESPLVLRGIMHDLGEHMQVVTDAIAHEEWTRVEEAAVLIATHPEPPPEEKVRILTLIGAEAARFREYDVKAGEAAQAMAAAARDQDGQAVIDAFHGVQTNCHGCHQEFRARLLEHLYSAR